MTTPARNVVLTDDQIRRLPRPTCYAHQDATSEWVPGVRQMMDDLRELAEHDGCIAAAWAMSMVEAMAVKRANGPPQAICWLCKRPIKGRVYYQGIPPELPCHRGCRVRPASEEQEKSA